MKRIAVLMTCFNRVETTLRCLKSLFAQRLPEWYAVEVWLVDDRSPDKTGEKVKAAFPEVNVIEGTGSLFWCRGMRLAWDKAAEAKDYDFYLWLNDDVKMAADCMCELLRESEAKPAAIVSGRIRDPETGKIVYGASATSLNGNILLVPRTAYEKIGKIDGCYHQRYGDHDYGHLARYAGVEVAISSAVLGECKANPGPVGKSKSWSLARRWKSLSNPLEFHLGDAFRYSRKHKGGVLRGLASVVHITLKVMAGRA